MAEFSNRGEGMLARPSSTTERLEMFSDGVIAIAITLLVLEITVPETKQGDLFDALVDQWPSYVAFVISFVVIGIMWVSHHSMFERIAAVDRGLLFINLLLLLGIGFLPFPTALLASYVREGGANSHVAAAIYSANMVGIGIAFAGMWAYLSRRSWLLVAGIPPERVRTAFHRSLVGPIVYGLTIGLAFISAPACFVVYALIAVYFALGPSSRVTTPGEATTPVDDLDAPRQEN
jgi:TMEM175 potassium channel family protein